MIIKHVHVAIYCINVVLHCRYVHLKRFPKNSENTNQFTK